MLSSDEFTIFYSTISHFDNVAITPTVAATMGNNSTSPKLQYDEATLYWKILYTSCASLLTLVTIVGNLFILLAVRVNHKLRRIRASILIASLAVADLLVGAIVMPLALLNMWNNRVWTLGYALCQVWTAMDVISCTASISTLCVISVDRYIGVARPLEYSYIMTRRKLWISVLFVWLFSVLVLLATVRWTYPQQPENDDDFRECHVGKQLQYVIYSVVMSFFIPLFIILAFYYRVYRVAQKRKQNFVQTRSGVMKWKRNSTVKKKCTSMRYSSASPTASSNATNTSTASNASGNSHLQLVQFDQTKNGVDNARKNKAALTLGLVVGAFVVCWLPFFMLFVLDNICHCVPLDVLDVFTWLGYVNSALNPLIYAFSMKTFSEALRSILKTSKFKRNASFDRRRRLTTCM